MSWKRLYLLVIIVRHLLIKSWWYLFSDIEVNYLAWKLLLYSSYYDTHVAVVIVANFILIQKLCKFEGTYDFADMFKLMRWSKRKKVKKTCLKKPYTGADGLTQGYKNFYKNIILNIKTKRKSFSSFCLFSRERLFTIMFVYSYVKNVNLVNIRCTIHITVYNFTCDISLIQYLLTF